ncbi:putative TeaA receptor TeaR [Hirsutella rhossiliensis]|uniref:TeaA receptor TeaR n=1 Tax=Hirsutella rhossiliensis TaxID=111463 RepID=A0A9P8N0F7_9HYPO|nr:putative TeaA receptor TeaR [Hirsutella rhossiliensis]KAH0963656.1 putative TeaA receptor TeaR [Hirsutella rhossiliensis]
MTTISTAAAAATASALTPPSSSHGESPRWDYPNDDQFENTTDDPARAASRLHQAQGSPVLSQNGLSSHPVKSHGLDSAVRRMHSVDNLSAARRDKSVGERVLSPPLTVDHRTGRASPSDWPVHNQQPAGDNRKRPKHQAPGLDVMHGQTEDSKWIHRDKLAKIENEELQAAGIFVPRARAPSKQRRDRSQNRLARGVESADFTHAQSKKNSAATMEPMSPSEDQSAPQWDLRTPEEIAQDEATAYFTSNGAKGGSRIPVAKISPAPIPLDYLERGSQAARKLAEMDTLSYAKPRSRSASLSVGEQISSTGAGGRRSVTDTSPKKNAPRKLSVTSKSSVSTRPKTRSGPNRDSPVNRPSTRTSENATANRAPDGDPPWMVNSYKPDPRLPPDQQLLPTVARRLQQEKWEKEGKFGDAYDTEFRPLNDKELLRPTLPPLETGESSNNGDGDGDGDDNNKVQEEGDQQQADEWPLKQSAAMPTSPIASPRTPITQQPLPGPGPQTQEVKKVPEPVDFSKEKGACGCCVVM